MVAVERAKHQLADAIRTFEMVQRDLRQAKAADEAAQLLILDPVTTPRAVSCNSNKTASRAYRR